MKSMNDNITAMISKLNDTSVNSNKQEEKPTELSPKLSTYEYYTDKVNTKRMLQPLSLQVNNDQDEKITELSSKLSTYEDYLEKMSITKTQIQPMSLNITEILSKLSAYENCLQK